MGETRKIELIITGDGKVAVAELGNVGRAAGDVNSRLSGLAVPAAGIASVYAFGAAVKLIAGESIRYLGQLETANLGIASSFMLGGKYVDQATGKALQGQLALSAAQADAKDIMQQLQVANMQTIATLDQLVQAYQQALPVAMAKGFNRQQVLDYTVAMVQAAGAIGVSLDQLGEETRSLLTGNIDPRTSRIATVLGLRNEDIRQHSANAQQLFDFLMQKLEAYKIAGTAAQQTWEGLTSNAKDIALQAGGQAFQPLFEAVKYELTEITGHLVTIDEKTKKINWHPDFVSGIGTVKGGVNAVVAEVYRMNMLLDLAGGSMTAFGSRTLKVAEVVTRFMTIGQFGDSLQAGSESMSRWNKMYEQRYAAADKALQALADREVGVADETQKKIAADYQQKKTAEDTKEKERRDKNSRDIAMVFSQMRQRDLLIGKSADEKELLQLDLKHQQEIKKLKELHATKRQLREAAALQEQERQDIAARQAQGKQLANAAAESRWDARREEAGRERLEAERNLNIRRNELAGDFLQAKLLTLKKEEEAAVWSYASMATSEEEFEQRSLEIVAMYSLLRRDLLTAEALEQRASQDYWLAQRTENNLLAAEQERQLAADRAALVDDGYQQTLLRLEEEKEARLRAYAENTDSFAEYERRKTEIESFYSAKRAQIDQNEQRKKLGYTQNAFANMATAMDTFYRLSHNKNKLAFRAYQAAKSGETIISTASSTMKAFDEGMKTSYWTAWLYAGAAAIKGGAELAALWSASPDGGGSINASGGMPATSASGGGNYSPALTNTAANGERKIEVNFHFPAGTIIGSDRDTVARELTPYIQKALNDGVRY